MNLHAPMEAITIRPYGYVTPCNLSSPEACTYIHTTYVTPNALVVIFIRTAIFTYRNKYNAAPILNDMY